jgi:uncharacterized membrane protein
MEPAIVVALLWMLFGGTHVGLASRRVREPLVAVLGPLGFFALFSLIATATFWALLAYYAGHRFEGVAGLDAGRVALVRWVLMGVIALGIVLIVAGLVVYPRLPVALFGQPIGAPRGIERVTRHPFFVGTALLGLAHVLLAPHLAGAVFMGGFAVLGIGGALHQDAKYRRARGQAYAEYAAATSIVPFAAILRGRQAFALGDLPIGAFVVGIGLAVVLRLSHASLFAHDGLWIVVGVSGGGALASVQSWLRARRVAAREAARPAPPIVSPKRAS